MKAIEIQLFAVPSFAVAVSQMPFISPATMIATAPSGYNPHSARQSRGFVQSGLQ